MSGVLHEARKAHLVMKNLGHHINKYTEDSLHIG